jgi:uncharacterized protein (DUF1330 family)/nicotinamidase-related amidase
MPNGYWLVQTDITDPEQHAEYVKRNRPVFARYGARILVRWGQHQVVEGVARSRQVVFEFPDYESAVACYHDPEYEAAHQLRVGAADGDVVIVEGYDGPQPAPSDYKPFTPSDSAILLIDHQPGVVAMVKSVPAEEVAANTAILARLGEQMDIPLVISSTRETLEYLGTTIEELQHAAPVAYENRIRRDGTLNAFHDPAFVDAVKALGRRNLIIAGILTDVCLWHSVVSALDAGYNVQVVADACGTTSALADTVTYDRMREIGVTVATTYGTLFELYSDLSTPEGQRAEMVAAGIPIPA